MSLKALLKLKMNRQQKTIDQADLIMGRLKGTAGDDEDDIDLIEQQ